MYLKNMLKKSDLPDLCRPHPCYDAMRASLTLRGKPVAAGISD